MLRLFIQYVLLMMLLISCNNIIVKQNKTTPVSSVETAESAPLLAEKDDVELLVSEFNEEKVSLVHLVEDLADGKISRESFEKFISQVELEEEDLKYLKEQKVFTEKKMTELELATINNLSNQAKQLLEYSQAKQVSLEEVKVALYNGNISLNEFIAITENTIKISEEEMKEIALTNLEEKVSE